LYNHGGVWPKYRPLPQTLLGSNDEQQRTTPAQAAAGLFKREGRSATRMPVGPSSDLPSVMRVAGVASDKGGHLDQTFFAFTPMKIPRRPRLAPSGFTDRHLYKPFATLGNLGGLVLLRCMVQAPRPVSGGGFTAPLGPQRSPILSREDALNNGRFLFNSPATRPRTSKWRKSSEIHLRISITSFGASRMNGIAYV